MPTVFQTIAFISASFRNALAHLVARFSFSGIGRTKTANASESGVPHASSAFTANDVSENMAACVVTRSAKAPTIPQIVITPPEYKSDNKTIGIDLPARPSSPTPPCSQSIGSPCTGSHNRTPFVNQTNFQEAGDVFKANTVPKSFFVKQRGQCRCHRLKAIPKFEFCAVDELPPIPTILQPVMDSAAEIVNVALHLDATSCEFRPSAGSQSSNRRSSRISPPQPIPVPLLEPCSLFPQAPRFTLEDRLSGLFKDTVGEQATAVPAPLRSRKAGTRIDSSLARRTRTRNSPPGAAFRSTSYHIAHLCKI
ncbi:hypothetical protein R3P38DRAFT_1303207 [Favolaschia claudopus]|uniref:Uncharacterized protein n=1 Tax=Favolaschia claudopus TaxID=2862362 RepID=A0AAW0AZX1_9AGAR